MRKSGLKFFAIFLFLLVAIVFGISRIDAGAEESSQEAVIADTGIPETANDTDSSDARAVVLTQQVAETAVSAPDTIDFLYLDKQTVDYGSDQSVAVGLSDPNAVIASADIEVTNSDGSQTNTIGSTAISGNSVCFTFSVDPEQYAQGEWSITKFHYQLSTSTEPMTVIFTKDEVVAARTFEVSATDTTQESSEGGEDVTAYVVGDEGQLEAAPSVDDALAIAAEEQGESEKATLSSETDISSLSSVVSTRDDYLIVMIDPGHGGEDSGAIGYGLSEKDLTLSIARHMRDELSTYAGVSTVLTRDGDYQLVPRNQGADLQARAQMAKDYGADVFISVHINAGGGTGSEVWVPNESSYNSNTHTVGEELGEKILARLVALGLNDRGVKTKDYGTYPDGSAADYYAVIRNTRKLGIPGILVEHAFIDTASEASKLRDDSFRNQLGIADATGVAQQFELGRETDAQAASLIKVSAHIANLGWEKGVYDGKISGTTGKGIGLQAVTVSLMNSAASSGGVEVQAHVSDIGWQNWTTGVAGTTGQNKAIEAIRIRLTGDAANRYDVYYRVHSAYFGWLGWAKNGDPAGTQGYARDAQAIQVVLVEKGGAAPGSTIKPFRDKANEPPEINTQAHVQDIGWQDIVSDGAIAGTTGRSLNLEALKFSISGNHVTGGVEVQAHVSDIGWQNWTTSEAGTTGQNKAIEAIRVRLTDEMANKYDVYYRVHSAYFGWLGWAKNGDSAGTQGYARAAQAVQITLVAKGGAAPGSTDGAFKNAVNEPTQIATQAHVQNIGWQDSVSDGATAGTTGRSLNLEALKVAILYGHVTGGVEVQSHVSEIGWQNWTTGVAGTTGQNKAIEAIRVRLTDELANEYDVYYRVHSAYFGWLGWAKNGDPAGTQGYARAAQAVQISLVAKGGAAPGSTDGAFLNGSVSNSIMGPSLVSPNDLVAFFQDSNNSYPSAIYSSKGAATIQEFCQIAYEEAEVEGVRPEVLFSQAMLETGWLQFGGQVSPEQCNFGGIGALDGGASGATFDDVRTGLRAQVQHLKAYASTDTLVNTCVDPRFNLVQRGTARTVSDLSGKWASSSNYGAQLDSLINRLV